MKYRTLGTTKQKVSALGFGCMRLPVIDSNPSNIEEDTAIQMIRYAVDHGVNYFDTAYPYHGTGFENAGESEPLLAKALREGYRERVGIATKLPTWLIQTREDMDKFLDIQLKRLETDHIDYYLIHALNKTLWEHAKELGIAEFLDKAVGDGRINYAGFSFHDDSDTFIRIVDEYDWSFCQIQYNYLDETNQAGKAGLDHAAHKGLGVVIMEPLRGGNLVNKLPDEVKNTWDKAETKRTPAEWALRWLWNHPEVSLILSGMSSLEQVVENIGIAEDALPKSLSQDEIDLVDRVKTIYKEKMKVNCTGCKYCMPCPNGVNIPKNLASYNDYYLFDDESTRYMTKMIYPMIFSQEEKPSNCVECGECETHCPQQIPIIEELKNVQALFEQS